MCKFRSWDSAFLRVRSCSAESLSCFSNIFVRASRRSVSIACSATCARSWPSVASPKNSLRLVCLLSQHRQAMLSEGTIASSEGCQVSASFACHLYVECIRACFLAFSLCATSKPLDIVGRFHTVALPALQTSSACQLPLLSPTRAR